MSEWGRVTEADLQAIHDTLFAHHPGAVDRENREFLVWLEQGLGEARSVLDRVDSQAAADAVIRRYIAGFRDPHVAISGTSNANVRRKWPGFVAGWRDRGLTVLRSTRDVMPVGAVISTIDGLSAAAWMHRTVFPFVGDPRLPASWANHGWRALFDDGNPFTPRAREVVTDIDSATRQVALVWEDYTSSPDQPARWALTTPIAGITWITAPTFELDPVPNVTIDNSARADFDAVMVRLLAEISTIRSGRAIVIDVRGNGGGNSTFGLELARTLWTRDVIEGAAPPRDVFVEWRVSSDNVAHLRGYLSPGWGTSDGRAELRRLIEGLDAAARSGQPLFRQNGDTQVRGAPAPNPITAPVFVLIDGGNGSATLDFLDLLAPLANVTRLGLPTGADSAYMDVRVVSLPRAPLKLVVPMKVYRNRPRPPGGYYSPDVPYVGLDRSRDAIAAWATKVVQETSP